MTAAEPILGFSHPPQNVDAEQALLGSVLINNDGFPMVDGIVDAKDFYQPAHRRIYAAMARIIRSGGLADHLTLKAAFDADDELRELDGGKYLAGMARAAETILNGPDYARVIKDMRIRRDIITVAERISAMAYDTTELEKDGAEIAADLQRWAGEIVSESSVGEITTGQAVLRKVLDKIDREIQPLATGISSLDQSFGGGLRPGSLYAIEGKAKRFKTGILSAMHRGVWSSGVPSLFVTLELSPSDIIQRHAAGHVGMGFLQAEKPANKERFMRGAFDFEREHEETLDKALFAHAPGASFQRVLALCSQAIVEHDAKVFVVDYWQRIPNNDLERNQSQHLEHVANALADFAARHDVAIIMASQLNRQDESLASSGLERACAWRGKIHMVDIPTGYPDQKDTGIWIEVTENRYGGAHDVGSEDYPAMKIAAGPTLVEIS